MKKTNFLIVLLVCFAQNIFGQSATGTITQVPCNNDGIYTVTTTGVALPITYTYFVNGTTVVHANVNSTTDQLTNFGMDDFGNLYCQVTSGSVTTYAQNSYTPPFTFDISGVSPVCPATIGTLTATQTSGTTGPFSIVWTNSESLITYNGNNASAPVGNYTVEITDQITGCVRHIVDSAIYLTQLSSITATISTTPASCTNGSATAVPSGGVAPYSYQWSNGATTASNTGLIQGGYTLVVTDNLGCYSPDLYTYITQNPQITVNKTVTNSTCVESDGSVIAFGSGGSSPYTYVWSNGQTGNTASNLQGNTVYTVVATDANGCIGQTSAYVQNTTPINVTYTTNPSQCTSATGSAALLPTGGTAPYTYVWSTLPSENGATISNVAPGSYPFAVTDAVGCVRTGTVVVNPISSINAFATGAQVACPATTGNAIISTSGSNPPFSYLWSNGATTQQITGVPLGSYTCTITDAVSCSVTKTAVITAVSPVVISVATTPVTCQYAMDGSVTSSVTGGVGPYVYSYSNGTSSANATGLGMGQYSLTVTDANGCSTTKYFVITNSNTSDNCYCTISGHVYVDGNADCIYDSGETGVQNIMMHCSGIGYTFTDANGYYSFHVPTGTYIISEQVNGYYPLASCQSNSNSVSVVATSGCTSVVDIANDMNVIHDTKIVTMNATIPPIPGNTYQQKIIVKNEGTQTESGINMGYLYDGQMNYSSSNFPSLTQPNVTTDPYFFSVLSGFPTLAPSDYSVINMSFATPTDIPLGTELTFYDSVAHVGPIASNWMSDYTPWNNVNTFQTTVIGSYDPNYKEVSPKGIGTPGYIASTTTEFDYTIHFQNEGTYYAQNIVVTDQLDADLDWTTLKPGYSDYSYTTEVSETGLVTFTFANINLPWKEFFGDAASSGLINYSIRRKASNPQGTEFTNSANIYFDYNAPITTNTTLNTLNDLEAGVDEVAGINADELTVDLYPVPAKDVLTVRINNIPSNEKVSFHIIDLMGNIVLSDTIQLNEGSTSVTQNISNLAKGTYLTRIQFNDGSSIVKKIMLN